jgi:hypothetical protein
MLVTVVLAQMLPPAAVKGGTALKLRLGIDGSRFSLDLDVARKDAEDAFLEQFAASLREGWGGFTGEIRDTGKVSNPSGVPQEYIMISRNVKVQYAGQDLITVLLEIGHDELGDTDNPARWMPDDILGLFAALRLPQPQPVPVIADDHQIAQKLHAVSAPGSERAHDLVDLQLLAAGCDIGDAAVGARCRQLFRSRKVHEWPPTIELGSGWEELYAASANGLPVAQDVHTAITWANDYIARLNAASGSG